MPGFVKIDTKENGLLPSIQKLLKSLLELDRIDALMVPWHLPMKNTVMPTLITDPADLDNADPLAPCFPLNAAKIASRLTKKDPGRTIALMMRSCEIRAFIELIKLRQGNLDDIVIIAADCLGAYDNTSYSKFAGKDAMASTKKFYEAVLDNQTWDMDGIELADACRVCEHPVPENADIVIELLGADYKDHVPVKAATLKGEQIVQDLDFSEAKTASGRKQAVKSLISDRIKKRDKMFDQIFQTTSSIEKLSEYLARCVNCYNCRVACPVCYCRECVFVTDVFDHDPFQYMQWAKRKGKIKMPTDTLFFHLTRMAHIGLTCIGCGQCSNACPNDIPLMELFRANAFHVQKDFEYQAGRSVEEPIPFSEFKEKEYEDIVGIKAERAE